MNPTPWRDRCALSQRTGGRGLEKPARSRGMSPLPGVPTLPMQRQRRKLQRALLVPGDLLARLVNRIFNPAQAVGVPGFSWRRSILGDPCSLVAARPGLETEIAAFR